MVAFNVFARLVTSWILIIGLAQVTLDFFSKEQQWRIPFISIKLSSNEDNFLNIRLWPCYYLWTCSLRKQPTFGDATTGFPTKWRLRNERRNSILMKRHYPRAAWEIYFNQSEALPWSGWWRVISMEFLRSFLRRRLAGKLVVASPSAGCFLRLVNLTRKKVTFLEPPVNSPSVYYLLKSLARRSIHELSFFSRSWWVQKWPAHLQSNLW